MKIRNTEIEKAIEAIEKLISQWKSGSRDSDLTMTLKTNMYILGYIIGKEKFKTLKNYSTVLDEIIKWENQTELEEGMDEIKSDLVQQMKMATRIRWQRAKIKKLEDEIKELKIKLQLASKYNCTK